MRGWDFGSWSIGTAEGPVKLGARGCRNTNDRWLENEIFVPHLYSDLCLSAVVKDLSKAGAVQAE